MTLYINGEKIDEKSIQDEMERLRPEYERVFEQMSLAEREKQLAEWSRENVIEGVLLRQEAARQEGAVDPKEVNEALKLIIDQQGGRVAFDQFLAGNTLTEEQFRHDIEKQIQGRRLLQKIEALAKEPSDKQIRGFYEENKARFMMPEMMRAAHIVKHAKPGQDSEPLKLELSSVLAKLHQGEDFSKLAQTHSDCPDRGGDLGWFSRGQMVQAFEDVLLTLKPGQISDVFETEFGFHIAKLIDMRSPAAVPLQQVREVILEELYRQSRQKVVEQFVDKLRSTACIEDR
ncbi:MAG: peptidylprolyl isomerase [Anaerohalosphaeraceae bacterium]